MEHWKRELDNWLTREPDSSFDEFCEKTMDIFFQLYFSPNFDESEICEKWLNTLFDKKYSPEHASEIIKRAFAIYILPTAPNVIIGKKLLDNEKNNKQS